MNNKTFWNTVKPFITNKSGLTNNDITLIHNNETITDEYFNERYMNIVEKSSGVKPTLLQTLLQNMKMTNNIVLVI